LVATQVDETVNPTVLPKPTTLPQAPAPAAPSLNIMPQAAPTPQAVMSGLPAPQLPPAQPQMREFGDAKTTRQYIYEDALAAAQGIEPIEDDNYSLRLTNINWHDPERYKKKDRKHAVLTGETLSRRMKGTWELYDKKTGALVEKQNKIVGAVPYLSSMGTFTHRGNEYTVNHQQRLKGGVFARIKDNGEIESHFNILPGKGVSHRYFLDPEKGQFKIKFGQSEMPLMPLLQAMGATDREIQAAWGPELWQSNLAKNDAIVLRKLSQRLLRRKDLDGSTPGSATQKLVERFNAMELDPSVTRRTLGQPFDRVSKEAILAATGKLLRVSKKEEDPDDRDHLAYQQFLGPEDLFSERLRRDHNGVRKAIFREIAKEGSLKRMKSGALTGQLEQVLVGSGLAQALEEINPAEVFDKQSRITRLGEGGIPSVDSIPDEARSVQPSHMGFMDPIRTPESFRVGVDLQMARASRKGRDGQIYTLVRGKDGKEVYKSPEDLSEATIATPEVLSPKSMWAGMKRIPVMKAGKIDYVGRDEIDYTLPDFNKAFSPLSNLVPFMSATKPGRVSMGARYMTQALPVKDAESPWVQNLISGDAEGRSYEDDYGKHMGALRAEQGGRVMKLDPDGTIHVKYEDGTTDEIDTYQNHPFNRKTYIHQTPVVKVGDTFQKGGLLARSNYTDDKGATALGLNMRVAYFPYKGLNFEDAQVISESAAKRLSSEHMYQHDVEVSGKHKMGLKSFVGLFPGKFDRKTLETLDDQGVIKVGQTVEYGQPLILAAKERDRAQNKIHKKRQPGYSDDSVLWKHHDTGTVTDVVWGKNGPVVLVKSTNAMQVGDKMSGRYGDKGVVSAIIPDDQMPHDKDGKPFEVLLSPDGIITRTNPSQEIEAALGKLAQHTGQPVKVPDFENIEDLQDWADKQLKQAGLSSTEDVIWPEKGTRVPGIGTGYRFMMKLHHTAESKGQGRDSGSYSTDETPAKGGESGCFTGDTLVRTWASRSTDPRARPIGELVAEKYNGAVASCLLPHKYRAQASYGWEKVTDWFEYRVPATDLITLTLANGQEISVTKNHVFFLKDGSKKLAGDLREGDDLLEGCGTCTG
jgi:DNA-directed RNA polymerase beta subunit